MFESSIFLQQETGQGQPFSNRWKFRITGFTLNRVNYASALIISGMFNFFPFRYIIGKVEYYVKIECS